MKLEHISEPRLEFARGEHICPRRGISSYGVFDQTMPTRRTDVILGGVGTALCMESFSRWVERCSTEIAAPADARQPNLRIAFPGFSTDDRFGARLVFGQDLARALKKSEIDEVIAINDRAHRIEKAIELYYDHIKFLAQNRPIDVIVCVIPESLYKEISKEGEATSEEETLEATVEVVSTPIEF